MFYDVYFQNIKQIIDKDGNKSIQFPAARYSMLKPMKKALTLKKLLTWSVAKDLDTYGWEGAVEAGRSRLIRHVAC